MLYSSVYPRKQHSAKREASPKAKGRNPTGHQVLLKFHFPTLLSSLLPGAFISDLGVNLGSALGWLRDLQTIL
jgi:hypothetical protein